MTVPRSHRERGHGMQRWYVIHAKPAREAFAQAHLERQGYHVYFPRAVQAMRAGGKWPDRIVALFPRYLFLRLDEGSQALNPVRSTRGVASVVRFGNRYTVVPDSVIAELHAREDPHTGLHHIARHDRMAAGDPVRVTAGLFSGLQGIFERQAGTERVLMLLSLLGHYASVCVPLNAVASA